MKIQGAHIVISGGAGALGKAFAMYLASRGARVLASDQDQDGLVSLAKEGQKKAYAIETFQGDITQEQEVERLFQSAVDRFGRVDVVINNAGIATWSSGNQSEIGIGRTSPESGSWCGRVYHRPGPSHDRFNRPWG